MNTTPRTSRLLIPAAMFAVAAACAACAWSKAVKDQSPPDAGSPSVCYECFWKYQSPAFRQELIAFYENSRPTDPLIQADVRLLLARTRADATAVCEDVRAFDRLREAERDPARRLVEDETVAFTAAECGDDPAPYFRRAAESAKADGEEWKASLYRAVAKKSFHPRFGEATIGRRLAVPEGTVRYLLGESAIHLRSGSRVGVQMDRTVRDWLSYQMAWDFTQRAIPASQILNYHEGARLRELVENAGVRVVPLTGTIAARRGGRWFAPDDAGVFRFEVLPDKVEYPTTRAFGELALLVDTHGISSLVERAIGSKVDLVIGCGDSLGKAQGAYCLARRGIDVYTPCDRFGAELLGHDASGVVIGSGPIRPEQGGAVIGDCPVNFDVKETIVVEDTAERGATQYYDAPARYFRALSEALPLRVEWVQVDAPGQSERLIQRADETAATALAVRVWNEQDYAPVRDWLAGSPKRRAVLFHTAPYEAGYRLFREFPRQTTFGDPRPRFITARS